MPENSERPLSYRVEYSERSEAEIQAIYLYILQRSEQAADRWIHGLLDEVNRHAELVSLFPGMARPAPDVAAFHPRRVYQTIYGKRSAAYRILSTLFPPEADETERNFRVLRVRHGSQQWLTEPGDEAE